MSQQITAVTCVKNEGPFLLEWIAWHRLRGVTHFLFYSNDCTDGTDTLLDRLSETGWLTHLPNPAEGRNYQMEALKDAARQPCLAQADWVWVADVDEFPLIHVGEGTFADLIAACGTPKAISLNFHFFANGGVDAFEDRPVTAQFTSAHNPDIWGAELAIEVKSLVSIGFPLRYFGAHRPFAKANHAGKIPWTDGSGRQVPDDFHDAANKRRIRRFPARGARAHATLHHYALRSLESYLVKCDRGDVNRSNRAFDVAYWRERNDNAVEDTAMLAHQKPLLAEMARLKKLPGIAEAHDAAVSAHRAKIAELLKDPVYRDLASALKAAPQMCEAEEAVLEMLG